LSQILAKTSFLPAKLIERVAPSAKKRGRLQVGAFADITLFDPASVNGVAGYELGTSSLPSQGIVHVLVNGQFVVEEGALVGGVFPGEPIRGELPQD
jgi:dihydroorotase